MFELIMLGMFVAIPLIIVGIQNLIDKIDSTHATKEAEQNLYNLILDSNYKDETANIEGSIKDLPQLTFDKWLNFYNINPDNWDMERFDTKITKNSSYSYLIPTYYRVTVRKDKSGKVREIVNVTGIPTFWSSPEEMMKFDKWYREEYKTGKSKGFENRRDESLAQLANFLQEDAAVRRKELQEEYDRIVDSVKVKIPDTNIELTLQQGSK